jgi:hypothetical protein
MPFRRDLQGWNSAAVKGIGNYIGQVTMATGTGQFSAAGGFPLLLQIAATCLSGRLCPGYEENRLVYIKEVSVHLCIFCCPANRDFHGD